MYVKTSVRKTKTGEVRYLQLAHNERDPAKGRSVPKVIYGFGREDQLDTDAVRRLVASLSKLLDPGDVPVLPGEGLEFAESRPYGGAYVLDQLWKRLGISTILTRLASPGRGRPRDAAAARGGVHAGRTGPAAAPARVERAGPGPAGRRAGRGGHRGVEAGDVAGGKRTAADLGAWLVFEDESGQGLRPPKGRTRGRRGRTPVVTVTGGSNKRVSLAALIAVRPGQRPRLTYRVHARRRPRGENRKGFTETDYARLLDAAHQQLSGPVVLVWDNLNTHVSQAMADLIAARDWLTVCQLPPSAHELNSVELVWSHLKRSLANLAKRNLAELTSLVKTRLKRMKYRPALLGGFLASTRLNLTPFL
jgi:putative transposase